MSPTAWTSAAKPCCHSGPLSLEALGLQRFQRQRCSQVGDVFNELINANSAHLVGPSQNRIQVAPELQTLQPAFQAGDDHWLA